MKKESKSESGQPDRSVRDEEIMSTWSFLIQHIVRGNNYPSDEVTISIYTLYFKMLFAET